MNRCHLDRLRKTSATVPYSNPFRTTTTVTISICAGTEARSVSIGSTSEEDLPAKVPQSGKTVVETQLRMMGHVLARSEGFAYRVNSLGSQRYEVFILGIDKWEG